MTTALIRVSTLESFRRVVETAYGDSAELMARLRAGQWNDHSLDDNPKVQAGIDWHKALSLAPADEIADVGPDDTMVRFGTHWFRSEDVQRAIARCGPGTREITGLWEVGQFGPANVVVTGTADQLAGTYCLDHKTKFDNPDVADYERSLQWRFYLHIHEASRFVYHFWHFKNTDDVPMELKSHAWVSFYPYRGMVSECRAWVAEFVAWAQEHDLLPHLIRDAKDKL